MQILNSTFLILNNSTFLIPYQASWVPVACGKEKNNAQRNFDRPVAIMPSPHPCIYPNPVATLDITNQSMHWLPARFLPN